MRHERESLKKDVLPLRAAWREDEKARRGEHEADKTKPLRSHILGGGFRLVVAKLVIELLQREAGDRMNLAQLEKPSLEAALFRARPRHAEPKREQSMGGVGLLDT